jgi:hypothetical protein
MLGLVLIIAAVLGLSKKQPFPGHWALLPTLGAALVILFATPATLAGRLLSTRVMVGVGLISYSAYLWHWPLFAFARIAIPSPSINLFLALAAASLGMAWFSWRYVERPFRNRQLFKRRQIFRFAAVAGCSLAVMGGIGFNGLASRFKAEDADLMVSLKEYVRYQYAVSNQLTWSKHFTKEGKLHILLLGDSYASDFINIMSESNLLPDAEIYLKVIFYTCQIYYGTENIVNFIDEKERTKCAVYHNPNFYSDTQTLIQSADIIIFAAQWREWSAQRLPETIKNLNIPSSTKIFVVGTKDFGKIIRRKYIGMTLSQKITLRQPTNIKFYATNVIMQKNLKMVENVEFFDLISMLCGEEGRSCPVFSQEGKLLSHDGMHLTRAGAQYIGALLKQHPVFSQYKAQFKAE